MKTASRDVHSLADHIGYLSAKITFLLDATLGMINNEQNTIIKIFSVLAVALMPPTLVGTIYGMNFKHMPELEWALRLPYGAVPDGRLRGHARGSTSSARAGCRRRRRSPILSLPAPAGKSDRCGRLSRRTTCA